jgi:rod shape-determining protein MreB
VRKIADPAQSEVAIGAIAGGGAMVRGICDLISHETGILTHVAEDPLLCVVNGCGMVLEDYKRLERVLDTPDFARPAS